MKKAVFLVFAFVIQASAQALADTHYMYCFGGGRYGLYYSAVFPAAQGVSREKEKAFSAYVKAKYGTMIIAACHLDMTQALGESAKKIREGSDQNSRFPSKLIETGWAGL